MTIIERKKIAQENSLLFSADHHFMDLSTFYLSIFYGDILSQNLPGLRNEHSCKSAFHENVYITNIYFLLFKNVLSVISKAPLKK